ncbi:ABC transporter ATP-binding protein [Pseudofrankia sp. BMG5.36]|uniref:ABC transporter ATP-binding protein n=1 Tax=Pseudofrankia sp. BMG5.36 TaxID=1834512 RepID=UPI0009F59191|nr:ABC transporter ATP-binding protein [Pseudofrankia sp. BMG5.36]
MNVVVPPPTDGGAPPADGDAPAAHDGTAHAGIAHAGAAHSGAVPSTGTAGLAGGDQPTGGDLLRAAVRGQRRRLAGGVVGAICHQGGEALVPVLIGVIIDRAVATGATSGLLAWLGALAADFVLLSLGFRFGFRVTVNASEWAGHDLRLRVAARVVDDRGGAEEGRLAGELTNLATSDVRRASAVNLVMPGGTAGFAGLVVAAVALLNVSIVLGLLVLLGTPPLLWLSHLLGRPLERRSAVEQERAARASGVATDLATGLRVLKGIGAEDAAVARYRRTSQDSLAATLRAARAQAGFDGAVLVLNGIFLAVVALLAGRLAAHGEISIGGLVTAVGLAQYLLSPLGMVTTVIGQFAQARASATRIAAVLGARPAVAGGRADPPAHPHGRLRIGGLACVDGLRGVDLDVAPGELLGLVVTDPDATGALLRCLARERDPDAGVVELDGVSLADLPPGEARRLLLVADHDADLFAGTLAENVASGLAADGPAMFAAADAPTRAAALSSALAAAGADEVARALPDGVDTEISEFGRSLSGGQRQRVALARALAADPPVLVLHEPTTAVDTVTEARIATGLRELRRGRTTVLVATSPALLAVTDRVVMLDGGGVRADGTHRDLLDSDAGYRAAVLA